MKKVFLMFVVLALALSANAQVDYDIYLDDGLSFNGNQWHYDNYSIMEVGSGSYLIANRDEYYYQSLFAFDQIQFGNAVGDPVVSFRPLVYNNYLGWWVKCYQRSYFCYPDGRIVVLSFVPRYYNYRYDICHHRYLSFRDWHWYHHRPYRHAPVYRSRPPHHGSYQRPHQPPHRPNYAPQRPPKQPGYAPHHPSRPSGNVRPPQNSRPHYDSRPSHNQNSGYQSRPSQRQNSGAGSRPGQSGGNRGSGNSRGRH